MRRFRILVTMRESLTLPANGLVFAHPVRIHEPDIPHAAPLFADVDGDGKKDLLVGQHREDPLRVLTCECSGTSGPQKCRLADSK